MASNFSKIDKFERVDFRRWQKKMHFLLSSMSVVYVLTTPIPEDGGDDATVKQIKKRSKWDNDDYVCRGLILNDFKHTLKHPKKELTLVELDSHLRIEESLRVQDSDKPKGNNVAGPSVVNMVEHNNFFRYNDNKGKREKVGNKANDLGTKGLVDGSSNSLKGATVHVCKERCWFKTYKLLNDGSILHMGNVSTTLVHGHGCVDLRFSSGKMVSLFNVLHCMTRSSTKKLFTSFKNSELEFRSSSKLFKTLSLDKSRSPVFDLFSDIEENSKEKVAETMAETIEEYMSKNRADYRSGVTRPKINDKNHFELKGQFLKELPDNTFSGSDHEDANEHIEKVLEIVDLFHVPNITQDQIML
ncbi:hypothetical protein Tco_0524985 [Tanacetum coccineum]